LIVGYSLKDFDTRTAYMEYTPFHHSLSWVNIVYGKKWKPGIFIGYMKNLGTSDEIRGASWGTGLDLDQLFATQFQLTYNLPHWKFGFEYTPSIAWYGTLDRTDGKVVDTHSITNHRILGVMIYSF